MQVLEYNCEHYIHCHHKIWDGLAKRFRGVCDEEVTILNVWIDKVSSEIALSVQRQYSIALRGCSAMSRQLEAPLVH